MVTHFFVHKEYLDWRFWCIKPITNDNNGMYDVIDIDELIQVSSGVMPTMKKGMIHSKSSEWRRTGPYSMACEGLSFGRCKSFFSHVWTLTRKQDLQQWNQQHNCNYSERGYCTGLPNKDSLGLGCQSRLLMELNQWKGNFSYSPYQVKYQGSTCWARPPIRGHYEIHCQIPLNSSHWYIQTMWRLPFGQGQSTSS